MLERLADPIRLALMFEAAGKRPQEAPKKRQKNVIRRDLVEKEARRLSKALMRI